MLEERQQNSANHPLLVRLVSSTDHVSAVTGAAATALVQVAKDGAVAWTTATGTLTELGNGLYWLAGNATDRNTVGDCAIRVSVTGADDFETGITIVPLDPFAAAIDANLKTWKGTAPNNLTAALNVEVDLQTWLGAIPNVLDSHGFVVANMEAIGANYVAYTTISSLSYLNVTDESGAALATASALATAQTAINNINNLSALANLRGPGQMEIPASGSIVYPLILTVHDEEGHLLDLSANPTLTATNGAGVDRSTNLSAITHSGVGQYTFTYTVQSTAAQEGLQIGATGTTAAPDSKTRIAFLNTSAVSIDVTGTLAAIQSQTTAANQQANVTAGMTTQGYTTTRAPKLDNLDAAVSSRMATFVYTAPINLTAAQIATGILTDTTSGDFATAGSPGKFFADFFGMIVLSGSVYQYTANALANSPAGGTGGIVRQIAVTQRNVSVVD